MIIIKRDTVMKIDWNKILEKTEKAGNKLANSAHKIAICGMLFFIGYQIFNFNKPIEYQRRFSEKPE